MENVVEEHQEVENIMEGHQEMERGTPRDGEHRGGTQRDGERNTKRWRTLMEDILEGHIEDTVVM